LLHGAGVLAWLAGLEIKSVATAAMIAVRLAEMLIFLSFGLAASYRCSGIVTPGPMA